MGRLQIIGSLFVAFLLSRAVAALAGTMPLPEKTEGGSDGAGYYTTPPITITPEKSRSITPDNSKVGTGQKGEDNKAGEDPNKPGKTQDQLLQEYAAVRDQSRKYVDAIRRKNEKAAALIQATINAVRGPMKADAFLEGIGEQMRNHLTPQFDPNGPQMKALEDKYYNRLIDQKTIEIFDQNTKRSRPP